MDVKFDHMDKHIQQLVQIKLGLQDRSNQIFRELINDAKNDPLDDIFKTIIQKNQKIREQTEKIIMLQGKLRDNNISYSRQTQVRTKSLPQDHEKNMKQIEGKKKQVAIRREAYSQKVQSFIIFLMKCLRQISKAKFQNPQHLERSIRNLENKLINQKNRVLQLQQRNKQVVAPPQRSEASTKNSLTQEQNLQKLVKQIKGEKDAQKIFTKIHERLGLQQQWNRYINKLKDQNQSFQAFKKLLFASQRFRQSSLISEQNLRYQQLINDKKFQMQKFTRNIIQQVQTRVSQPSIQNYVNQWLQSQRLRLQQIPQQAFDIIFKTIVYFYQKLDKFFERHNQNPFQMKKRAQFKNFSVRLRQLMITKQWEVALKNIRVQIDEAFYTIDRRTKFYSSNRIIIRNKY